MADYKLPVITGTELAIGDLLRWDGSNWVNYPDSNYAGGSDELVGVDADAAAGYLGAASNDGVLRVGASLSYADGGDYITLDTIQDIRTIATPTFANLTLTSYFLNDRTNHNFGLGYLACNSLTSGTYNYAFGFNALEACEDGFGNIAIGYQSLLKNISGDKNVAIGYQCMNENLANENIAIGYQSLYANTTGTLNVGLGVLTLAASNSSYNTILGHAAGRYLTSGASNVFIGFSAGRRQTELSNLLIIDNRDRTNVATELTNALIYGIFAAAPANQTIRLNAGVIMMASIPGADPSNAGQLWNDGGTLKVSAG